MATSSTLPPSLNDTLSIKSFGPPSNGDNINKALNNSASNVITQNIKHSVKLSMGNNTISDDIPKAVNFLLHRNYPIQFDENGERINKEHLIQICVPEIFLSRSSNFVGPPADMKARVDPTILKDEILNLGETTTVDNVEGNNVSFRHLTEEEMLYSEGALKGYVGNYLGDKVEHNAYLKFKTIFQDNGEEFGLFHSYDLHDFGLLQLRTCCIELRVSLKPGPGKPISLNGKYKILFHRNLWIHENKTAFIWYDPAKGWVIGQIQKNGDISPYLFGGLNMQCPCKTEEWFDRMKKEVQKEVHVQKINDSREKDLIAINKTRRCVFMVSCKRKLSMKYSKAIEDSKDELNDGWDRFKGWFASSNKNKWKFIPLIYYEIGSCPAEFSSIEDFIIKGTSNDELRQKLDKLAPPCLSECSSDKDDKQFVTMFKYLAFAASAAEAPVPQILTKEITERVQKSGTPENVKLWMFWTPPQLELLYKYQWINKVCFVSGNGVGKTVLMMDQAMKLARMNRSILFCIRRFENMKSLLEMKFENYFMDTNVNVLGISKIEDLQTYNLKETHVFIDECPEAWICNLNNIQAKSIWIALGELLSFQDQKYTKLRDSTFKIEDLLEEFKREYGPHGWYFPFNNLTLRATQTNSKKFAKWSKRFSEPENPEKLNYSFKSKDNLMIGSLNKFLNLPNNTQIGPKPKTLIYGKGSPMNDAESLTEILMQILLGSPTDPRIPKIQNSERILIVKEWKLGVNSKEIADAKKYFDNNKDTIYNGGEKYEKYEKTDGNYFKILMVLLDILQKCKRVKPLIWLQEFPNWSSDEKDVKKWINGKMHCDLITDSRSIRGFEEPVVLHLGGSNRMFGEDILTRSTVKFLWISYDNPENETYSFYNPYKEYRLEDMTISHNLNDKDESDRSELGDMEEEDLMINMINRIENPQLV